MQRDDSSKKIRIHDFKHSHDSLLINQGEDYFVGKIRPCIYNYNNRYLLTFVSKQATKISG